MSNRTNFSSSGFSLIELVISVTTMSVVGFLVSNLVLEQRSSVNRVEDRFSALALEQEIISLLSNKLNCDASFGGLPLSSSPQTVNLRTFDGNPIISTSGSQSKFDRLQIQTVNFQNLDALSPNSSGKIVLSISLQRERSIASRGNIKPLSIPIYASVDGGNRISECSANSSFLTNRTISSTPPPPPEQPGCRHRSSSFSHGEVIQGSRIFSESCHSQYACLYGHIVPAPLDCRSGRNNGD